MNSPGTPIPDDLVLVHEGVGREDYSLQPAKDMTLGGKTKHRSPLLSHTCTATLILYKAHYRADPFSSLPFRAQPVHHQLPPCQWRTHDQGAVPAGISQAYRREGFIA